MKTKFSEQEKTAYRAILAERLSLIRRTMYDEGIENFCISWSGGKDSCVISKMFDLAVPDNQIPRVYADTGLDLTIMRDFIKSQMEKDKRIVRIAPTIKVKPMLEKYGYPFASKRHSALVERFRTKGLTPSVINYLQLGDKKYTQTNVCPIILRFQFDTEYKFDKFNTFKISDKCCFYMKEQPIKNYMKQNNYKYNVIGLMAEEGGRRKNAQCFVYKGNKLKSFQPLAPLTKDWEDWFIKEYDIEICDIYKPPYNFDRTGCKGCPFSLKLRHELDVLEKYFPNDRKQCEALWKPVYDQYRLIRYRLLKEIK